MLEQLINSQASSNDNSREKLDMPDIKISGNDSDRYGSVKSPAAPPKIRVIASPKSSRGSHRSKSGMMNRTTNKFVDNELKSNKGKVTKKLSSFSGVSRQ